MVHSISRRLATCALPVALLIAAVTAQAQTAARAVRADPLDPKAVAAFTAIFERGEIRIPRKVAVPLVEAVPDPQPRDISLALETTPL